MEIELIDWLETIYKIVLVFSLGCLATSLVYIIAGLCFHLSGNQQKKIDSDATAAIYALYFILLLMFFFGIRFFTQQVQGMY